MQGGGRSPAEMWLDRQDIFFPTAEWPSQFRDLFRLQHRNNRERFTLFLFFTGNGMSPSHARQVMSRFDRNLDAAAQRQLEQLERNTSDPDFWQRYSTYDMTTGHWERDRAGRVQRKTTKWE